MQYLFFKSKFISKIIFFIILSFNIQNLNGEYIIDTSKETLLNYQKKLKDQSKKNYLNPIAISSSSLIWEKYRKNNRIETKNIEWEKFDSFDLYKLQNDISIKKSTPKTIISSMNRSIVIDYIVGPDISWLVPPGLAWSEFHHFDFSVRGHNRRKDNEKFLGWNGGDAVGQIYYQPINNKKYSFGLNLGIRSVYSGSAPGGQSPFGEGLSMGFRVDKRLSENSGIALGAEQLLHFDGLTDTGRDIYITASKAWWKDNIDQTFPLSIATFGFGTGKMAEGNIKGLCSDLLGGSGTEVRHQRSLCWAPIFSLAKVYNPKISTFFEYNSKWFLIGSSFTPFESIPLRGTFAVQISDHIDNYKINSFDELKWNFRLSYGF